MLDSWCAGVSALLIDATGVLYNSTTSGGVAIPGSMQALNILKEHGIPFKICSNQSTQTRKGFTEKLKRYGYSVSEEDIICPGPVIASELERQGLRPHLLVHPASVTEFDGLDTSNPNCVVVGDMQDHFSYEDLNEAFRVLHGLRVKKLYTYGGGKYYRRAGNLVMDCGSYAAMLQHACECEVTVCGKPEPAFFNRGLQALKVEPSQCVMIGDDIASDIGGAKACGIRGVQVRTGKYRPEDEAHPLIEADAVVDNLLEAVNTIISYRDRHDSGIDLNFKCS